MPASSLHPMRRVLLLCTILGGLVTPLASHAQTKPIPFLLHWTDPASLSPMAALGADATAGLPTGAFSFGSSGSLNWDSTRSVQPIGIGIGLHPRLTLGFDFLWGIVESTQKYSNFFISSQIRGVVPLWENKGWGVAWLPRFQIPIYTGNNFPYPIYDLGIEPIRLGVDKFFSNRIWIGLNAGLRFVPQNQIVAGTLLSHTAQGNLAAYVPLFLLAQGSSFPVELGIALGAEGRVGLTQDIDASRIWAIEGKIDLRLGVHLDRDGVLMIEPGAFVGRDPMSGQMYTGGRIGIRACIGPLSREGTKQRHPLYTTQHSVHAMRRAFYDGWANRPAKETAKFPNVKSQDGGPAEAETP